ncbi:hypothetical protein M527_13990 [Sphingobium indicum IP26]|nr:hypothetical protein M527_13990 [Sphingobium indicum IP26]
MRSSQAVQDEVIIKDFGAILESPPPGHIHDTNLLPHPKDKILKALLVGIGSSSDPEQVNALGVAAIFLSDFQDGVGESISFPVATSDPGNQSPDDMLKVLAGYDFDKFQRFSAMMQAEGEKTMKLIEGMKALNPIFQSAAKPEKKGWRRFFGL